MSRRIRYSQEVRERAVGMVIEHEGDYASQWEAIRSIAEWGALRAALDEMRSDLISLRGVLEETA